MSTIQHRDAETQRHGLESIAQQAVSLCLCVSVLNSFRYLPAREQKQLPTAICLLPTSFYD